MMETRYLSSIRLAGAVSTGLLLLPGMAGAAPQSSVAGVTPPSIIVTLNQEASQGKRLPSGKPRIATRPEAQMRVASPTPDAKTKIAALITSPEAQARVTAPEPGAKPKPVVQPTPSVSTPRVAAAPAVGTPNTLAARGGTQPPSAAVASTSASQERERVLLAQLDADLKRTEQRLDTTNEKLSKGQQELASLSNTLRTVMDEIGADAEGLHPFVRVASRYAGTPYVWGGESRYGFDCSGFIIRVMRDLGYKALPHSAAEQFKYGTPVAESLLKPGDIVFFANTYKPGISHVGIYIGKRRFIHAASTRQGTIVSSLDASPYRQKYAGARRLSVVR